MTIGRLVLCLVLAMSPTPRPTAHAGRAASAIPDPVIEYSQRPSAGRPDALRSATPGWVQGRRRSGPASRAPHRPSLSILPQNHRAWPILGLLCLLLVAAPGVPGLLDRWWERRTRARARRLLLAEIDSHRQRLGIRRLQLVGVDDYGTPRPERWEREKRSFCRDRLQTLLAGRGLERFWDGLRAEVERAIERSATRGSIVEPGFDPGMDPLAYERFCAGLLRRAGWTTRLTAASGDQGADILATRRGILLVVQCKLYRGAVGNSAVQQVSAARLHQRAMAAIVVSNARFTSAARDLARTNGVALLHHDELPNYRPPKAARPTIRSATR